MNSLEKQQNFTLFSAKAIACFFIICIHTSFPGKLGFMVNSFGRFAVPLFFMITGYYSFYLNKEEMANTIKRRIHKLLPLLTISFLLYLLLNIIIQIYSGSLHTFINGLMSPDTIGKFLLLNWTTPVIGVGHVWYLFALLYVYLMLKIINKHNLYSKCYIYSFFVVAGIYILEVISVYLRFDLPQIYYRNAWFMGLAFFMIGHFIRKHANRFKCKKKHFKVITLLSLLLIFVSFWFERNLMVKDNALFLTNILTVFLIFFISINKPNIHFFDKIGARHSGTIYIIHYLLIILITYFFPAVLRTPHWGWIYPFVVFSLSLLTSVIYNRLITLRKTKPSRNR